MRISAWFVALPCDFGIFEGLFLERWVVLNRAALWGAEACLPCREVSYVPDSKRMGCENLLAQGA